MRKKEEQLTIQLGELFHVDKEFVVTDKEEDAEVTEEQLERPLSSIG